jgi:hypothetical protein
MKLMRTLLVSVFVGSAALAADPAPAWETIVKGPISVKNRDRAGTAIKEVWAEGEIAAPVQDIQQTLMTPDNFRNFMPYLKQSRTLDKEPDGSVIVYTELALPVVASRDYVVHVWLDEGVKPDGSGAFRNHWVAVPDRLPERANLVRVKTNDGSWYITPTGDGSKSWAVYKFAVDPGGWVPAFAANMGNEKAVADTFKSVEKEARRLRDERAAKAAVK